MDDLISRQAAIELWEEYHPYIAVKACEYDKRLRSLPSAERRGRWVYNANFAEPPFKCSACGKSQGRLSNYCPDCGAKMDEVTDGE